LNFLRARGGIGKDGILKERARAIVWASVAGIISASLANCWERASAEPCIPPSIAGNAPGRSERSSDGAFEVIIQHQPVMAATLVSAALEIRGRMSGVWIDRG